MSATGASKDFSGARIRIIADNRTNRILVKVIQKHVSAFVI